MTGHSMERSLLPMLLCLQIASAAAGQHEVPGRWAGSTQLPPSENQQFFPSGTFGVGDPRGSLARV